MKMHIENLNITLSHPSPLAGLIATQSISGAQNTDRLGLMPAIGEKWPGLDAVYAGVALSQNEDSLVHLVLWAENAREGMAYGKDVARVIQLKGQLTRQINKRSKNHE